VVKCLALLGFLLGLIAGAGACSSANCAADYRARRATEDCTDRGSSGASGNRARTCTGLIVTFGGLSGHGSADRADRAADNRARRAAHRHSDGSAAERACPGADGLAPALLILRGGIVELVMCVFWAPVGFGSHDGSS
jgi:hypothetical protein